LKWIPYTYPTMCTLNWGITLIRSETRWVDRLKGLLATGFKTGIFEIF